MKMFQPINEYILVRPLEEEQESAIFVPKGSEEDLYGEVVKMGDGAVSPQGHRIPPAVNVSDKVYFKARGAAKKRIGDEDLYLLTERQILGVVE